MKISIAYTHSFEIKFKRYKKKFRSIESDIKEFTDKLEEQVSYDLGHGFYKYRLAIKSKNTGKSGGFRIITFEILISKNEKKATLLTIFDKSEQSSISKDEILSIMKDEGLI